MAAASTEDIELEEDEYVPTEEVVARIKQLADVIVGNIGEVYTLGDELGRGRFSVVQSAKHLESGLKYAVKVVENKSLGDEENLEALETEVAILRQLNHPHIVGLKEVVVTAADTFIVMELLSGGELFNRIVEAGAFSEAEAAALFAQILLSMEYLHSLNIVHRDVKPENILYVADGSSEIKLIDFGYAGIWSCEKELTGLCGTPDYVAPEVLSWYEDDESGTPYGKGSDLWSLGVLLYVILSGCSPFSADEEEAILELVKEARFEYHETEWGTVSAEAKDLISKLLVVDPGARLTMAAVLQHPWLKQAVTTGRETIAAKLAAVKQKQTAAPPTRTSSGAAPLAALGNAPNATLPKAADIQPRVEGVGRKRMGACACVLM